mgnify:CR=1 FL=1
MKVFVITQADYDYTEVVGVAATKDAAVEMVRERHKKQKTANVLAQDDGSISVVWHGGAESYGCEQFDVHGGDEERQ